MGTMSISKAILLAASLAGALLPRPALAGQVPSAATAGAGEAVRISDPRPAPEAAGTHGIASWFPVAFDSERIRLHVLGDSLEVRGTYWLLCRGRTDAPLSLIYPFPEDSLLGAARMVSLRARVGPVDDAQISWQALPGRPAVRWRIPPCSADTIEVEAVYRQALLGAYARYIVTTTRAWQEPLRHAAFEIHLPPGAKPVAFSFPFERTGTEEAPVYVYRADDFFPDRDISVRWEP